MNIKHMLGMGYLLASSVFLAHVKVEIVQYQSMPVLVDSVILTAKETKIQFLENIRLDSIYTEAEKIIFYLSYKDVDGNYLLAYVSDPLEVADGDEIMIGAEDGFNLKIKISKSE